MGDGMSAPNDKSYCVCGAEMEMIHASVVDGSDLGCCWLQCESCGQQSTPVILEHDARWYWENYKNAVEEVKDNEHK